MRSHYNASLLALLTAASVVVPQGLCAAPEAYRDPPDQPFRRAPMALSTRSIVVPLSTNLHLAFDPVLLRVHSVWKGPSLNLYGPPFTGTATRFICDYNGTRLWGNPPVFAWTANESISDPNRTVSPGAAFKGISTKGGLTTMIYEVGPADRPIRIHESFSLLRKEQFELVKCRFEMAAATIPCRFLAIAEMGGLIGSASTRNGAAILRTNDFLTVFLNSSLAALEAEENQTDYQYFSDTEKGGKGPYSAVVTNRVSGTESRVWVKIPAHDSEIGFDLLIAVCNRREDIATVSEFARQSPVALPAMAAVVSRAKGDSPVAGVFLPDQSFVDRPGGDESYRVEHFPIPKEVRLMVGGMDFMPDGELAISTMPGEIYLVEGVTGKPADARWRRFARGLNEPLGLKVVNGEIYVTQKCELTRVVDTDGNGEADFFECISASWGYNGNYHSFATGPVVDAAGNFFVMVAGHRTVYENPYMGWCLKVTPGATSSWLQGTRVTEGYCSGLRVPNGFGSYQGEVFMTDNQGHWIAANKLNHLQPGKYYGHPSAKPAPQSQFNGDPDFQPPAVWFPYSWVRSASGFATIPDDRFGPFKGQLLVGEFQNASVVRVMLEKVGGEWQGAVFPFINGFNSGVNRLAFGPDGKLYAGGLRMGHWTSIAPQPHSLDRVEFTGLDPFEIKEVHARASGFELVFTEPLEPGAAAKAETYDASQYHYAYDGHHNAPEKDRDEKIPSQTPTLVTKAELSSDHLRVRLHLDGFQPGYVTVVRCLDVRNAKGKKLRHDTFHYTLNRIPAE